jgi:hypothetical protein
MQQCWIKQPPTQHAGWMMGGQENIFFSGLKFPNKSWWLIQFVLIRIGKIIFCIFRLFLWCNFHKILQPCKVSAMLEV